MYVHMCIHMHILLRTSHETAIPLPAAVFTFSHGQIWPPRTERITEEEKKDRHHSPC